MCKRAFSCFLSLFCLFSLFFSDFLVAKAERYDLMLAGGALKTCSSFAQKNCSPSVDFSHAKQKDLYEFSSESLERLVFIHKNRPFDHEIYANIYAVLVSIVERKQSGALSKRAFLDALEDVSGDSTLISRLPDALYYALLDTHEVVQRDSKQQRMREAVRLSHNKNPNSVSVYQQFVEQARMRANGETPHILVVTASARDPFSVVDFYQDVFNQAGARTTWLPLTPALLSALEAEASNGQGCQRLDDHRQAHHVFDRPRVYPDFTEIERTACREPEKLTQMIESAHGVFINGGDQSKTLAALRTEDGALSHALRLITARMQQGQLIVGGTSAGTAVQAGGSKAGRPIPMFSNGEPEQAVQSGVFFMPPPSSRCAQGALCQQALDGSAVTLNPAGGTGLFTVGLLDTHFSERDREARLIMATAQSGHRLGFGVDETTALLVKYEGATVRFNVIGEHGVFIVDMKDGELNSRFLGDRVKYTVGGRAHYWTTGTSGSLTDGQWQVALSGESLNRAVEAREPQDGVWRREVGRRCATQKAIQWQALSATFLAKAYENTQFSLSAQARCGYHDLPFVMSAM